MFGWDPSKILIFGGNGFARMDELRERFGIELEMAQPHYALALTGAGDDEKSLTRLARALLALDRSGGVEGVPIPGPQPSHGSQPSHGPPPDFPPARMSPREALAAPFEVLPLEQAAGRVCVQYLWVYPPGIPLAVPGEELTPALLEQLAALTQGGAELRTSPRGEAGMVRVTGPHNRQRV